MNNRNISRSERYGTLESLYRRNGGYGGGYGGGCRRCYAASDCPECVTCTGAPLFYTGPCGSQSSPCGSSPCCGWPGGWPGYWPVPEDSGVPVSNPSAEFVATAPAAVTAGGQLNLQYDSGDQNAFQVRPSGIRIVYPGRYFASYTFQNPASTTLDTTLSLELDGNPLNASSSRAVTDGTAVSSTFSGNAIFEADAGDYLTLGSTGAITLPASDQTPVATLTLLRISD